MGPAMTEADARTILHLDASHDASMVKEAFRRQAKTAHPDAGGDADTYRRLVEARDLLLAALS